MPTYDFQCVECKNLFEERLNFDDYDNIKLKDGTFIVDCPSCHNMTATRIYDVVAHGHVVNSNIVGIYAEKNTKKIGKIKIEEHLEKKKESLKPKADEAWYGRMSSDKAKEITNTRKSREERQRIANKYIFEGK
jgi:putative FmdB family regulatory protein